ncbi:sialate O-acetylesterase [Spirosoma aerolatum]|uniref:sialate O-acetylesterase n=1 Tax=Spirosoma aerolatum TaxID=1211326 RepID=UPI0009AE71F6|nr:sialate O-acetylesterase [Spirosoma aerolatum]
MATVRLGLVAVFTLLLTHTKYVMSANITPHIVLPYQNIVYQRDSDNKALVPIDIQSDNTEGATVLISFSPVQGGKAVNQVELGTIQSGHCKGAIRLTGGDYSMKVEIKQGSMIISSTSMERVGVGDVFVVFGHSVAQGTADALYDNPDPRVRSVNYNDTDAKEENLPFTFSPLSATSKIAPYGSGPYAWGPFGNKLAASLGVPVLLFNTAFGGSNIQQNWKVINNQPFEHGFIDYKKGMPYQTLKATLSKYIPVTGIRAILIHHGVNDRDVSTRQQFKDQFNDVLNHTRTTFNLPTLPILIALEDAGEGANSVDVSHIRAGAQDVIGSNSANYVGADLLALRAARANRTDKVHLQPSDFTAYGELWANAFLAIAGKTSGKPSTLSADYTSNVANGTVFSLANVGAYVPSGGTAIWAALVGIVIALLVARKIVPALILLALVAFGLGKRIGVVKTLLDQQPTTQSAT